MAIHKLLDKQIRKHFPEGRVNDPVFQDFINAVNDSYEANDRDREILSHAFEMSEREYMEVNDNLIKEHELKKASIEKLKQAIKRNDYSIDLNFEKENDFLDVNKVVFWVSPELRSPMGSNAAAFASQQAAEKAKAGKEGQLVSWDELYKKIK